MNTNNFKDYYIFREAIRLKDVKKKNLSRKYGGAYSINSLKDVFGKKDRLVYNLDLNEKDFETANPLVSKINRLLNINFPGFKIKDAEEYKKGVVYNENDKEKKQPRKIGRLLQSVNDGESERLLDAFKKDPFRLAKDNSYKVVISRHPYDIAGMSTDRNWRSCMTLNVPNVVYNEPERRNIEGINKRYVDQDINEGSIVAYLVSNNDVTKGGKVEIRRPLARILMKPHYNKNNKSDIAYSIGRIYGAGVKKFSDFIREWLLDNVNKNTKGKTYILNKNLYPDGDEAVNFVSVKANEEMGERIFFEELNYRNDNSKSQQYFEFLSLYNSRTDSEVKISFIIPENIPLEEFGYFGRANLPQYINNILDLKTLPNRNNFQSIETFIAQRKIVIEYRFHGNSLTYEDEKGNDYPVDEYDAEELWSDTFKYDGVRDVNYLSAKRSILQILNSFDKEAVLKSETEELNAKMAEVFDENATSVSPNLKSAIKEIDNKWNEYLNDKKYFESLYGISFENLVNVSKTDEYKRHIRSVHSYMRKYIELAGRLRFFSDTVGDKYPVLGTNARKLWNEFLDARLPVRTNKLNDRLNKNTVEFFRELQQYSQSHTPEEYEYLKTVLEDLDTAFDGKTYGLSFGLEAA
jgi:hypothetical protein